MGEWIDTLDRVDFAPPAEVFPSPADWRDQFIYFLLVDRFDDGRPGTPPYDPATAPRGRDPAQGRLFQGGTLRGVMRRLEYVRNLGCTAIWLSPVFKNRVERNDTYHGYGIQDFLEVDPRFGTKEDLRALVRRAHEVGLRVILDIILNHTGDNWAYPGDQPYYYWKAAPGPFDFGFWRKVDPASGLQPDDAVWPREFQSPDRYKRRGQIRDWSDPEEAVNGDFLSLKELDITRPEVLDALIRSYKSWIAYADVDGFRVDTVKHMEDSATALFCNAVREYAKRIGKADFFIFGEVVGDDAVIQRYIGRNSRIAGTSERFPSLDACLDFPLYFVLEEVVKGFRSPVLLRDRYERFRTLYADHGEAGRYFVTFVDNHDQMARPYRRFMHRNPFPEQAVLAVGYLLSAQGIPCIYYGTEQGFDGGGDNDGYVRECMFGGRWGAFDTTGVHFFDESNPIYRGIRAVAEVRAREPALRYGRQYFRETSRDGARFDFPGEVPGTLAFSRILDTDEILVVMNLSGSPRGDLVTVDHRLSPPGCRLGDLLGGRGPCSVGEAGGRACVRVPLEGYAMALLKREGA
ncbi:alpha-amylase [Dissulfurirhabdus thermomarina]|uniref:Alpha-amylase n=1 Tax=Dissulfurirhabdus thermomarina TaxID=1765737 RepID=A0A6N9TTW5_DISTH|nr:alpha-amylase family glycosyl hydrolase [Dissulfurirhabdus thermomarina]NDY42877.1 alpha-amylase [Dissulfurirhabdus thermomarina]NMX24434.1 alpha-amylase [Dissulfurirhabdus thermomarina]